MPRLRLPSNSIQALEEVQVKLPTGVRIRINVEHATEETLVDLKSAADASPGTGKVIAASGKKGEYAVILEPEGMSVAGRSRMGGAGRGVGRQGDGAGAGVESV